MGDATNELIARIARDPSRPEQQVVLKTADRLDMTKFPIPAYELAEVKKYFLGSIQYSSGCPYQCEFCDIPGLYGRNPRLKTPRQITAELDKLLECGIRGSVYFVDDNFIGNREATLNIAKRPEILAGMREAFFSTIFCGIETPDPVALKAMHKDHNMMVPIMEAIQTLNSFGMEVVSGIILGLDTDKPETGRHLLEFIDASQIPLLTINLLQALPKTPLWDRLQRENRLIEDEGRESNVAFHLPYEDVVKTWRACMSSAYQPGKLLQRYEYQVRKTYPNQIKRPPSRQQASWPNIKLGLTMLRNIFWKVGVLGDYKIEFWKFALRRLARGEIEYLISSILVSHHLIMFARDASGGHTNASSYSLKLQEASAPAE